jgi:hypothetical protein
LIYTISKSRTIELNWDYRNFAYKCKFEGIDLTRKEIIPAECGPKCKKLWPNCTLFNYNNGMCYMKFENLTFLKTNGMYQSDAISSLDYRLCGFIGKCKLFFILF